jgi:ribosomal protein S18 acetylase RimI-like enzyme
MTTIARRHDPEAVERILRGLPDWFGIEESIVEYAADAARLPSYLAIDGDEVVGIALVHRRHPGSAELHLIAVAPEHHGRGVVSTLLAAVEHDLRVDGTTLLHVWTVGPSLEDAFSARSRGFYEKRGFVPLQELARADWEDPALILVKALASTR